MTGKSEIFCNFAKDKKDKAMKKIFYSALVVTSFILFDSCSGSNSEIHQNNSLVEVHNVPDKVFDFKENGYPGTYQFTDEKGVACTIVLKDDGTMTAQSSGSDGIKTGTWVVYNNDCPQLKFDDTDDPLFFSFPEGKEEKIKQTINDGVIAEDGYIYAMNIYYDAKKEEKRLPIKRLD